LIRLGGEGDLEWKTYIGKRIRPPTWEPSPANIIPGALQKQEARMLNEHQFNNQRTRGSITVK